MKKELPICSDEKKAPVRTDIPAGVKSENSSMVAGAFDNLSQITRKSKYRLQKRVQNYLDGVAVVKPRKPGKTERKAEILWCGAILPEQDLKVKSRIFTVGENVVYSQHVSGIAHCGSVFCPSCGPMIRAYRSHELQQAFKRIPDCVMMTFTISHRRGDSLSSLMDILERAHRDFWMNAGRIGQLGMVRAYECTYGVNGWHPHFHVIVFFPAPPELDEIALKNAWVRSVDRAGGSASFEVGLDIKDKFHTVEYAVKLGAEMTSPDNKDGRDFLALVQHRQKSLCREEFAAFRGKSWLRWSKGLRALQGLSEGLSDVVLADGGALPWSKTLDAAKMPYPMEFFLRDVVLKYPVAHDLWCRSFATLDFRDLYKLYAAYCSAMGDRVPDSALRGNPFDIFLPPRQPAPC